MDPFTVSAWINASTDTTWRRIIGRRAYDGVGWELALDDTGALVFALQSGSSQSRKPSASLSSPSLHVSSRPISQS